MSGCSTFLNPSHSRGKMDNASYVHASYVPTNYLLESFYAIFRSSVEIFFFFTISNLQTILRLYEHQTEEMVASPGRHYYNRISNPKHY